LDRFLDLRNEVLRDWRPASSSGCPSHARHFLASGAVAQWVWFFSGSVGWTLDLEAHLGVVSTACKKGLDLRAEAGHRGEKSPIPAASGASCVISPLGHPWPPAGGSGAAGSRGPMETETTRTHRVKMSRIPSDGGESRTTRDRKKSAFFHAFSHALPLPTPRCPAGPGPCPSGWAWHHPHTHCTRAVHQAGAPRARG